MSIIQAEASITADEFRHAFRSHPAGVAVVTADSDDGPVAMTVSSVASVSINPPTLVFSASALSSSTPAIRNADTIVVHMLAASDVGLAKLCATRGADRFGPDVEWDRLPTGEPYYPAAHWLRCRVTQCIEANGSSLIVVEAIQAKHPSDDTGSEPTPLVYHNREWHILSAKSAMPRATVPFYAVYGRND